MTTAERIADRLLALINSSPRTPTREQMVEAIERLLDDDPDDAVFLVVHDRVEMVLPKAAAER